MTEDELLECPFCGHNDSILVGVYITHCDYCGGSAPNERWNTRVVPAWLKEKIVDMKQTYYCSDVLDKVLSLTPGDNNE